ncbi:MAG: hypothetical protein HY326_12265, partial [Chloroflexi bacterium]|nr:hypothetical protein [Chloroflexota bacterium]
VRPDGFASVNAPLAGGEFTTPPLTFQGAQLAINFATSVLGTVGVEIQDEAGHPLPGHSLSDCEEIYGDALEQVVTWQGKADLPVRAGQPVRLRFALRDADLYAFQFRGN